MASILSDISQQGDIKLVNHKGAVIANTTVDDNGTDKTVQINMQCLNSEWSASQAIETNAKKYSCGPGNFTYQVGANWKIALNTPVMNRLWFASQTGMRLITPSGTELFYKLVKDETHAIPATPFAITLGAFDSVTPHANYDAEAVAIDRVLGVVDTATDKWFYEAAAVAAQTAYTIVEATGKITFEATDTLHNVTAGYIYTTADDTTKTNNYIIKSVADGFIRPVELRLTWLVYNYSTGVTVGYVLGIFKNCLREGDLKIGGAAQESTENSITFNVSNEKYGDTAFYWSEVL